MAIDYPPSRGDSVGSIRRYDLYVFCDITNVIVDWQKVEAHGLEAAMEFALRKQRQSPMELWSEGRLIRRWE